MTTPLPLCGACLCETVRYEVTGEPLTVYACHCADCQTASGASFVLSIAAKSSTIRIAAGEPRICERPRADGRIKRIIRCPTCLTALWGVRPDAADLTTLYAGTLRDTSWIEPVGHIWTRSAQPWIRIPPSELNFEEQPPDMLAFVRAWQSRSPRGS